jgi:hypothetical protein
MRKVLAVSVAFCMTACAPLAAGAAGARNFPAAAFLLQDQNQDNQGPALFTPDQLDNLVAPIALYPDPLLAQVLLAATFPDQIDEAARTLRASNDHIDVDSTPWDVSVKAVAHYPTVLYMMADKLDWTTSLGQAYVNQSTDVMESVQRLRAQARDAGNLASTPQQNVVEDGNAIEIWPAQPQYIYVPVYDPGLIFFHFGTGAFLGGAFITFGTGFPIGVWLNHDCDWRGHRIYYHGWENGSGWVGRSRPFVRMNNVYVNNSYRNVTINRTVVNRTVNYGNLNRYNSVHRNVDYNDVHRNVRVNNTVVSPNRAQNNVNNKVIERNMNTNDQRINTFRGHDTAPASQPVPNRGQIENNRPQPSQPQQTRPQQTRPQETRPQPSRPAPSPAVNRPVTPPPARRAEYPAFNPNRSVIPPNTASQRGQQSRQEMSRPAAPPPQASRPPSKPSGGGGRRP